MLSNKIENELQRANEEYQIISKHIEVMQQNPIVKKYIEAKNNLKQLEAYQNYLKQAEIGEDGTLFEGGNNRENKYYGLSFAINCALFLKYYGSDKAPDTGIALTFNELLIYLQSTQKILNMKIKYEGDQRIESVYNLEIYQNPQNNRVLKAEETNFEEILKNPHQHYLLPKALEDYNINTSVLIKSNSSLDTSFFLVLPRNINKLDKINMENLSRREQEAFFGEEAQRILGVPISTKDNIFKVKSYRHNNNS